ncbi:UNVERIFIED_ORG: putative MFS family arabinose efflux permease [Arthrobacter sp. UYEF10]
MLPMMVGLMGMAISSGIRISKTGKYKTFPILGASLTIAAMPWLTTLTAETPIWVICVQLFVFGAGLGTIMQVIVLVVHNSVPADQIGTATSTNDYFREIGASLGGAEAERLEAEHLALLKGGTEKETAVRGASDSLTEDDGELASRRR